VIARENPPRIAVSPAKGEVMPSNELSIPTPLSNTLQNVQDEDNIPSALMIATNAVQIAPTVKGGGFSLIVQAPAQSGTAPSFLLNSQSTESSIRFAATGGTGFNVGVGGFAGAGTFFFFNDQSGIVVKIESDGDVLIAKNLTVSGQLTVGSLDGSQTRLVNVPAATSVLKHLMIDPATGQLFTQ
jgi:hypothetical protein